MNPTSENLEIKIPTSKVLRPIIHNRFLFIHHVRRRLERWFGTGCVEAARLARRLPKLPDIFATFTLPAAVSVWLQTVCNAWITSSRMEGGRGRHVRSCSFYGNHCDRLSECWACRPLQRIWVMFLDGLRHDTFGRPPANFADFIFLGSPFMEVDFDADSRKVVLDDLFNSSISLYLAFSSYHGLKLKVTMMPQMLHPARSS